MLEGKKLRRAGAAVLALVVCLILLNPRSADASERRRNFAIGTGIIGGIIASEIVRDSSTKASQSPKASKRYSSRKSTRSKKTQTTARAKPANPTAASPQPPAAQPSAQPAVAAPASNATPISTPAEIASAQEHLRYMGYDVPQATGTVDLKTKIATMQFQESIGAQTTGILTAEQLRALFAKVAERHAGAKP